MKTLRNLMLFCIGAALLSTIVSTNTNEASTSPAQLEKFAAVDQSASDQIKVYTQNKAAIDAVWIAMDEGATMCEAIAQWTELQAVIEPVTEQVAEQEAPSATGDLDPESDEENFTEPRDVELLQDAVSYAPTSLKSSEVCTSGNCGLVSRSYGSREYSSRRWQPIRSSARAVVQYRQSRKESGRWHFGQNLRRLFSGRR